jgi:hypothetical protein
VHAGTEEGRIDESILQKRERLFAAAIAHKSVFARHHGVVLRIDERSLLLQARIKPELE